MVKIGILKEEKVKTDMRVPFSPDQCKFLQEKFYIKIQTRLKDKWLELIYGGKKERVLQDP